MSITNYSDLQTEIADWIQRTNLTSKIPTFIANAEGHLNRVLRVRDMETTATGTLSSNTIDLSTAATRFRKVKVLYLTISNAKHPLNYTPAQNWAARYADGSSGIPVEYSLNGDNLIVNPSPDSTYDWTLNYYQAPEPLATAGTNWLLTRHPDLYLAASLTEAYEYMKKRQDYGYWLAKRNLLVAEVNKESRNDYPGGTAFQSVERRAV